MHLKQLSLWKSLSCILGTLLLLLMLTPVQALATINVRDDFNNVAYNNNDSDSTPVQSWATDWTESGENGPAVGPSSGDVFIIADPSVSYTSNQLLLQNKNNSIERQLPANFVSSMSATLSFVYRRQALDDVNDNVTIDIYNGSAWTTLDTFAGPATDGAYQAVSYTITTYAAANTRIRFSSSGSLGGSNIVYFDDIRIDYNLPPHFNIIHDGYGDTCTPEEVKFERNDFSHNLDTSFTGPVTLSTSTGKGDWAVVTASGTLDNGTADDGDATYTFVLADAGDIVLSLADTTVETLNINISDGTYVEDPADDPDLTFAGTSSDTFRDEFNDKTSYAGSDGTISWNTKPWQETGDDSAPATGDIRIMNETGTPYQLLLQGDSSTSKIIERQLNLTGTTTATLTFDYKRSLGGGKWIKVFASGNGGSSWTEIEKFTGSDGSYLSASLDLTSYIATNTMIRFEGKNSNTASDVIYIDDVQILKSYPLACVRAVKLQILVPGETADPGSATGKTGTPIDQIQGVSFNVTVNAVDADWNVISSNVDTVAITSSDGVATMPADAGLVNGTATFSVTLITVGTTTVTATDVTGPVTANTSPAITVNQANRRFNAFETGTAAGATTGVIKTKIAGAAFNLDLVALNNDGPLNTTYAKTVTVELLDSSDNSAAADSKGCRSSWTTIQTLAPNPQFTLPDSGRITVSFTENETYADARVRVTENIAVNGCSEDNFAIRPNSFSASITDTNWTSAGTGRTLNNTALANTTLTHKAGRPFTITATAINALTNTTTNYTANPDTLSYTACAGTGCTSSFGTLSPGTWNNAAGVATANAAVYSEVGAFTLTLEDRSFADVDIADSTTAERYIVAPNFDTGRFVPDYFDITLAATPVLADNCSAFTPFTYLGESFGYSVAPQITVIARNAAGGTTQNYEGSLWRLGTADPAAYTMDYAYSDSVAPTLISPTSGAAGTDKSNCNGTLTVTLDDTFTYTRPAEASPYTAFDASIDLTIIATELTDSDGVCYTSTCVDMGITGIIGASLRHGLLQVSNNFGPETEDITGSPVAALYYDGVDWVINTADGCTAAPPLTLCDTVGGRTTDLQATMAGGEGTFTVTTAGTAGEKLNVCATAPAWLTDDACGAPDTTCGEITFGLYRGNDRIINWQEISR